jgi:uncharacterized protein (DUF1778 family)
MVYPYWEIAMTARTNRSEKLDLRLTAEAKRILATAAAAERRSLSDFVLESALRRAEETLADRHSFPLNPEKWAAFMEALDAPTRDLPHLKRLLREPSIFSGNDPA